MGTYLTYLPTYNFSNAEQLIKTPEETFPVHVQHIHIIQNMHKHPLPTIIAALTLLLHNAAGLPTDFYLPPIPSGPLPEAVAAIAAPPKLQAFCADNPKWRSPTLDFNDCAMAVHEFYHEKVGGRDWSPKIFSTVGNAPRGSTPEWTPMKFTRGE